MGDLLGEYAINDGRGWGEGKGAVVGSIGGIYYNFTIIQGLDLDPFFSVLPVFYLLFVYIPQTVLYLQEYPGVKN